MRLNTITGWSRVALGDLFEPLKRKNGEGEKRVLTVSGELGLVDQSEFFDRNIASKNLGNYWLLKKTLEDGLYILTMSMPFRLIPMEMVCLDRKEP